MFARYIFTLCVLAFVVIVNVEGAVDRIDDDNFVEPRNPALAIAVRFIAKELGKRVGKCAIEAAQACESDWHHFRALVKCAGKFAENNKGKCLI